MKTLIIILVILISASILTSCFFTVHKHSKKSDIEQDSGNKGEITAVPEFNSVKIDVLAADINFIHGDKWSVSYRLSEKEPIKRMGVEGDTLYLETEFDAKEKFDSAIDWFVTVTVPENASLSIAELKTVSGNIKIDKLSCENASFSSTSGKIEVQEVISNKMTLETVSDKISVKNAKVEDLYTKNVSGNINIDGTFGKVGTKTVSGKTDFSGSIDSEAYVITTSGNIDFAITNKASINAQSNGTIKLNGEKINSSTEGESEIRVVLHSVSGNINIINRG